MYFSKKNFFVFSLFLIYIFFDRTLWSNIAQWQVDEATTIYIGYTKLISDIKVGLISSQGIPNPNGMMFLSKALSLFPDLWVSSYVLSIFQFSLILILSYLVSKIDRGLFMYIFLPLIFCVCLRSISTHLSNQWILTLVNFLFLILILNYLRNPNLKKIILFAYPILVAPSLYLAGITNSIAYIICIFIILFFYKPKINIKDLYLSSIHLIFIFLIFIYFVWYPYLETIYFNEVSLFIQKDNQDFYREIFQTILNFPYWSVFLSAGEVLGTFKHNGLNTTTYPFWSIFHYGDDYVKSLKEIYDGPLSSTSIYLLQINSIILIIQSILSSALLVLFLFFKDIFKIKDKKIALFLIINFLFIFFIVITGAILGSPNWVEGERLDMQVNLIPFFLIFWFSFSWVFQIKFNFNKYIKLFSKIIFFSYIIINLLSGYFISKDHLNYEGKILSDADIPLVQKQKIIDFIVNDWKNNSSDNEISIGYYFPDKRYSWVNKFGEKYAKYYPNIYVRGREFDYILLRKYGLKNFQEGIQHREISKNEYIITYNTINLNLNNLQVELNENIGRLKVLKFKMKIKSNN